MLTLSNTDSINNTGIKCLSWTFVLLIKSQKQTWLKEHQGPTLDASLMEVQLLYRNLIPRVLSYPSLASKRERERERDPGWVWSRVSRTKFILREEATILCGHPSPRRSSCLQAKGSTFISQPGLLVWPCKSKYWPPTLQSSAQLTELILPWLRKALHPKNNPKVQLRHNPNHTKTSKWPVVSCPPPSPPTNTKFSIHCCFQLLLGELLKQNFGGMS